MFPGFNCSQPVFWTVGQNLATATGLSDDVLPGNALQVIQGGLSTSAVDSTLVMPQGGREGYCTLEGFHKWRYPQIIHFIFLNHELSI